MLDYILLSRELVTDRMMVEDSEELRIRSQSNMVCGEKW